MITIKDKLSKERKDLQEKGLLPEWFITPGWQMFKQKYLHNAQGLSDTYKRIAKTASVHTPEPKKWEKKFYEILWNGWLACSTPVLANMGTSRGCPVSCSGQYVGDSVYDFYANRLETAVLTKNGFGTSAYLGDVRPRGAAISNDNGKASGSVPVFKMFVQDMRDVSQGSTRRGSWAGYLPIDHGDFYELATHLQNNPDDLNIGWNVSNEFMDRLEAGDKDAIARFQRAMKVKAVTGKGYFFFPDKANAASPKMYKKHNLEVKNTNLCVAGETNILTRNGYVPIAEIVDEGVDVWNGHQWSRVLIKNTSPMSELIKVNFSDGSFIECTPEHNFYIQKGYSGRGKVLKVKARDLEEGMKLEKWELPTNTQHGTIALKVDPYSQGFYSGDGCTALKRSWLYKPKFMCEERLVGKFSKVDTKTGRKTWTHGAMLAKSFVPKGPKYSLNTKLEWLAGYLDADGCVLTSTSGGKSIQACAVNKEFLLNTKLLLQELGIESSVIHRREEGEYPLPKNDGTGESANYTCKEVWLLTINAVGVHRLLGLEIKFSRLNIETDVVPNRSAQKFIKVVSVESTGRYAPTYCAKEPKRGRLTFNGLVTGNCTEIMLHNDEEHSYTCVLSSMNLYKFDEWKDTDAVFTATVFLDCVAQEFIEQAKSIPGLEKAARFTEKGRALGLGALGFHSYLQKHMTAFESLDAHMANIQIFKHLYDESTRASEWLAEQLGEPEWCKGFGVRNTHRLAIAPNTTSALICGGVSQGIEPVVANAYTQPGAAGELDRINPEFIKLLERKGKYTQDVIDDVSDKMGSVQHLDFLTPAEKLVFKTAYEIDQKAIIRLASNRQRFIDQGQSLNLFFDADEDEAYIAEVHREAFLDKNIKALYYMRTLAGVQASKDECVACEG